MMRMFAYIDSSGSVVGAEYQEWTSMNPVKNLK